MQYSASRYFFLFLAIGLLMGCQRGYEGEQERIVSDMRASYLSVQKDTDDPLKRLQLMRATPEFQRAAARRDSLLAQPPSIRWWSDSLARADSATYAFVKLLKASHLFYRVDTTAAVFTFMEAVPWLAAVPLEGRAEEIRRFAETIAEALGETLSPNMARLSYQAFDQAKQLALASEDPVLYHLADSSYKAVARQVLTMPDSVRAAFGPAPDRPARIPWVLATLAAAFIAFGAASGCRG